VMKTIMTINELVIPPAVLLLAGALLLPLLPKKLRSWAFLLFTFGALTVIWIQPVGSTLTASIMQYTLVLCKVDSLSRLFGIIFSFIAFAGGIYAFHIKETGQQCAALLYVGGALGVTFAGDLYTLFIFWELMAVSSTYLIWARRNKAARKAGFRYLLFHVFGGGLLFMGIILHFTETGSLLVCRLLPDSASPGSWLMLLGVILNAAVPPLHAWLADAYPKATVTGAVFLSAFTTKTAVYVLIRMFPGWKILLVLGVIMTLYGVIYAILSNDIRGILAYHIISQVGYMVTGVGIGTELALNGSAAHAFSHILYKALLFMGAGAVLHSTGKSKLTELGGLVKNMRTVFILYMIAACSISGFPLFNGFISKSMIVTASGEAHYELAMLLLLLASVGTFLSVGLKLPYFTWYATKLDQEKSVPIHNNMILGMGLVGFFCIFHGVMPQQLYSLLPYPVHFEPYTMHHLVETVQLLTFTFIAFWLLRKKLAPHADIALDIDWLYRKPSGYVHKLLIDRPAAIFAASNRVLMRLVHGLIRISSNPHAAVNRDKSGVVYDPELYRPQLRTLVSVLLAVFIILVLLGLVTVG